MNAVDDPANGQRLECVVDSREHLVGVDLMGRGARQHHRVHAGAVAGDVDRHGSGPDGPFDRAAQGRDEDLVTR